MKQSTKKKAKYYIRITFNTEGWKDVKIATEAIDSVIQEMISSLKETAEEQKTEILERRKEGYVCEGLKIQIGRLKIRRKDKEKRYEKRNRKN